MGTAESLFTTRRGLIGVASGAFLLAWLPAELGRERRRVFRRCLPIMGTVADVTVVDDDGLRAGRALAAAHAELDRADRLLSRFRPDSEIGRANAKAGRQAVPVGADTAAVLAAALAWAQASDGVFDPCLGLAVQTWDVTHRHAPPRAERIAALAGRRLYESLELCPRPGGALVRFADADVSLDLGGIGKGWAVDRAAAALRQAGVSGGFVNVGGDLSVFGPSQDGDPWRVGVADPLTPGQLLTTLTVEDGALATSGDAEQHFDHGGRRYHHLIDPATGAPRVTSTHSVTVAAASCLDADAGATAAFGRETGVDDVLQARAARRVC